MPVRTLLTAAVLVSLVLVPSPSAAQGFGLGPRFSFVRGDVPSDTPSTRFLGGTLRMSSSRRVVLEAAMDYRSETSADRTTRFRERPIQGSLLLFPVRSTFAPYVLAGIGLYSQNTDTLDATGRMIDTVQTRKTGTHIGFGAEVFLSRRAALFADYRLRFVKFGTPEEDADPVDIPGSTVVPGLDKIKLSHRGSMWTSGMAFYF
jgi:hypothetical protein